METQQVHASGHDPGPGPRRHHRRRRHRHQHRLPPREARLEGHRPAGAAAADRGYHLACGRPHHVRRDGVRDAPVDGALHPRPVHLARGRDRAGDGLPADRAPPPRDYAPAAGGPAPRGRASPGASACRTRRSRPPSSAGCGRPRGPTTCWPAFYVPDEGRVNPADLTQAYAKGARMNGARIVEGVTVTGITQAKGRVTGVETDQGPIRAEYVVNAAGMWGREVGAMAGVSVPLQAAEHYYLDHGHRALGAPGPADRRGPGPLRLLPRGGWRHPRGPVRAEGRGVVPGRCPGRHRLRQPAARLGPHRCRTWTRRWTASRPSARPASGPCSAARRASRRT